MYVTELLVEMTHRDVEVRVWFACPLRGDADTDSHVTSLRQCLEGNTAVPLHVLAAYIASLPNVNAVQVGLGNGISFLVYPDWP
jgi:hypothetical protein